MKNENVPFRGSWLGEAYWRVLERRKVFETRRVKVFEERLRLPDDQIVSDYLSIEMCPHVVVAPFDAQGRILFLRQYKHGPRRVSLTLPAGEIEPGETPVASAERELLEETGLQCASLRPLGAYSMNGNQGCGVAHFFLGEGAVKICEPSNRGDLEQMEPQWLTREQALAACREAEIAIISHIAALSLALNPACWPALTDPKHRGAPA